MTPLTSVIAESLTSNFIFIISYLWKIEIKIRKGNKKVKDDYNISKIKFLVLMKALDIKF